MTEDTSPENLRKFLESEDPAMVMMGLSMAKGSGVPKELLPTILSLYMWDEDKTVRASAKSTFISLAPEKLKKRVKENWKASYRTLSPNGEKYGKVISPLLKSKDDMAMAVLYHPRCRGGQLAHSKINKGLIIPLLIKTLDDKSGEKRSKAAEALGDIAWSSYHRGVWLKRAVPSLIKTLEDNDFGRAPYYHVRKSAISALGRIGDKRAVEPLIKLLERGTETNDVKSDIVQALTHERCLCGDKRVVEPLIKALEDSLITLDGGYVATKYIKDTVTALGNIGDKRAIEPITKFLNENQNWEEIQEAGKEALEKLK